MKTILTYFFVTMGVVFTVLLLLIGYFFWADPYDIGSYLNMQPVANTEQESSSVQNVAGESNSVDTASGISAEQAAAAEQFGIDPSVIGSITPEQEACLEEALGNERVEAIKSGAVPTATDFFQARSCF